MDAIQLTEIRSTFVCKAQSWRGEELQLGGLGLALLVFADDVVLMASSVCDLQHSMD